MAIKKVSKQELLNLLVDSKESIEKNMSGFSTFEEVYEVAETVLEGGPSGDKLLKRIYTLVDFPSDLKVTVTSTNYQKEVLKEKFEKDYTHLYPPIMYTAAIVNIGDLMFMDLNYDDCKSLPDSHLKELVEHELVHYSQKNSGRLSTDGNSTFWTVEGEEYEVGIIEDAKAKQGITNMKDFFLYELKKPWEQEAYFKANPGDLKPWFSKKELEEIKSWVVPSLRHLVA